MHAPSPTPHPIFVCLFVCFLHGRILNAACKDPYTSQGLQGQRQDPRHAAGCTATMCKSKPLTVGTVHRHAAQSIFDLVAPRASLAQDPHPSPKPFHSTFPEHGAPGLRGPVAVGLWGSGAVGPFGCGALGPRGCGAVGPRSCESVGVWGCGGLELWGRGAVGLQSCGAPGL